ncbi:MAG: choice-of-anchor B family protein [Polaribacter sp.]|uniref:choice-of-anchor B family protein n=1 Tax=Polaribacter sp. TaxID=1920175 RepID=UPI002F35CC40
MIKKSLLVLFLIAISCDKKDVFETNKQIIINPIAKCENGFAGEYPCNDYDLLTYISLEDIGGPDTIGRNCWGWIDPATNVEYALMGTNKGITFIDITNPAKAEIIGTLKAEIENNAIRDVKVFNSFAYVTSEAAGNGIQIFNLNELKDVIETPVEFASSSKSSLVSTARNITINNETGIAYILGSNRGNGSPVFLDINKAFTAAEVGNYIKDTYSNDAEVITYTGPDEDHLDKEIFIGSNENNLVILDVTDKMNPIEIATVNYTDIGKTTKGSFTEDFKYFIIGDEQDEQNSAINTRTIVFDFTDLDNPVHHFDFEGNTAAIDLNGYLKGNLYYQANTTAGVRVLEISDVENKNIFEVGFFDTYPENDNQEKNGTWSVYPFSPSGNILISDFSKGFFIIRKHNS